MATYSTTLTATYSSALNDIENIQGWNRKFVIPYTFVAQASATTATDVVTVVLGDTPANWVINRARAVVTTAFTSTGTQTPTRRVAGCQWLGLPARGRLAGGVSESESLALPVTVPVAVLQLRGRKICQKKGFHNHAVAGTR